MRVDQGTDLPGAAELTDLVAGVVGPEAVAGFDAGRVYDFSAGLACGRLSYAGNAVRDVVTRPLPQDVADLPPPGSAGRAAIEAVGAETLGRGEVAVVVLGGGMATRFGGALKATVEVVGGRTFLELKLRQAAAAENRYGGAIPVAVMTGWATHEPIRRHAAELALAMPMLFRQDLSLRLAPDGRLFLTRDGRVSPYTTGHGDVPHAIARSGVLTSLRARGVRHLLVSNLDNLLALPDPAVVGWHALSKRQVTVEVVDVGSTSGAWVVRLGERPVLLDGSELPPRAGSLPGLALNTNTFIIDVDALDADVPLRWLYFEKVVDGRTAVQIERPLHHITSALDTAFLRVPAAGPNSRFLPIKTRAELARHQAALRSVLTDSGARDDDNGLRGGAR